MAAAECQSRQLAEVIATLDGAYLNEPIAPCLNEPAYEVHVEHVIGLRVALCAADQALVSTSPIHQRSVRIRST